MNNHYQDTFPRSVSNKLFLAIKKSRTLPARVCWGLGRIVQYDQKESTGCGRAEIKAVYLH